MSSSGPATARAAESVSEFVYQAPGATGSSATDENQASPGAPGQEGSNLLQISKQEVSRLVAEARAEGFRQGQNEARKEYEQAVAEQNSLLKSALSSFEQERATYYSKVETKLVHFALAIAAKILHREAQVDRLLV